MARTFQTKKKPKNQKKDRPPKPSGPYRGNTFRIEKAKGSKENEVQKLMTGLKTSFPGCKIDLRRHPREGAFLCTLVRKDQDDILLWTGSDKESKYPGEGEVEAEAQQHVEKMEEDKEEKDDKEADKEVDKEKGVDKEADEETDAKAKDE